jgi:hypothetical protein
MIFPDFLFADVLEYVDNSTLFELLIIPDEFVNALSIEELIRRARSMHISSLNHSNWEWLDRIPQDDQFDCYLEMFQNEPCSCRKLSSFFTCPTISLSQTLCCFREVYNRPIAQIHNSIAYFNFYNQISVDPPKWKIADLGFQYLQTIVKRFETEISPDAVVGVIVRLVTLTPLEKRYVFLFGKLLNMFNSFLSREVFELMRGKYSYYFQRLCKLLTLNNHGLLIQRLIDHGPEKYTVVESLAIIREIRVGNETLPNRLVKLKRFPVEDPEFADQLASHLSHYVPGIRKFALKVFAQVPTGIVHPMRLENILLHSLPTTDLDITEFQSIVRVFKDKSWAKDIRGKFTRYRYSCEFIEGLIYERGFRYGLAALDLIPKRINLRLSARLYISKANLEELEWHPSVNKVIRTEAN